jgi:site-specific DNA-adenine methylase
LKFYCKKESTVLDITYGRGLSWENPKEDRGYKIIKVDRRKLADDVIQSNFNKYLKKKESDSVDCVYFDPPYYFEEKIGKFNIKDQMLDDKEEVFWTEKEFEESLETLQMEVPRILKEKGVLIVKIMDGYVAKDYYPNAFKIFEKMEKVMNPRGTFICPIQRKNTILKLVRVNHIYYLVFQKKEEQPHKE